MTRRRTPEGRGQVPRLYADLAWIWPFVSPPEDYAEEVDTFRARFRRHGVPDGSWVLHLGSGGGSIDWHLKRYYRVTGVDRSPAMLAYAQSVNPEVEYLEGDIRDVSLGRLFGAVFLHDATAYMPTLADLRAAFATASAHFQTGGVLVTLPEELRSRFRQHRVDADTRVRGERSVTTVEVDFDPDPADTWFEKTFVFLIRQVGHPLRVEIDTRVYALYDLDDVKAALREVGFEPRAEPWELLSEPGEEYVRFTAIKQ